MNNNELYQAGLYCRLSKDDDQAGESVSIGTQRSILADYCAENQFSVHKFYIDDGYSGLNFNRPGFQELLADVESGAINMVITNDLSRLGRDYIMTGYYSEVYFPSKNVRYIAISDGFDSLKHDNDIAPFKNILNFMYAKDLSRKVKNAKRQRAKQGLFIGSQTPYGYRRDPDNKNQLIIDPEAAETVRQIFSLAEQGLGSVAIASTLEARGILSPAAYKSQNRDKKFAHYTTNVVLPFDLLSLRDRDSRKFYFPCYKTSYSFCNIIKKMSPKRTPVTYIMYTSTHLGGLIWNYQNMFWTQFVALRNPEHDTTIMPREN